AYPTLATDFEYVGERATFSARMELALQGAGIQPSLYLERVPHAQGFLWRVSLGPSGAEQSATFRLFLSFLPLLDRAVPVESAPAELIEYRNRARAFLGRERRESAGTAAGVPAAGREPGLGRDVRRVLRARPQESPHRVPRTRPRLRHDRLPRRRGS